MNSALLTIFVFICFGLGYKFYSKYVATTIFDIYESFTTPAHTHLDNIDYVPTKKRILFGHHFTSIAGAAPIIGPCIAAYWGWLPAILWIVFGTIFMGAVHDFGTLVASLKEKGRSIADIAGGILNKRIRLMFLIFVLLLTWLVLAVFAMAIADLFVSVPTSVLPVNIEIIVALIMGYLVYQKKVDSFIPSIIALALLYLFVWIGSYYPLSFESFGLSVENSKTTWIILLFIYSSIASLLPVWLLLQPRDYINSHQLIVGLGLLFLGLFISHPQIDAPAVRQVTDSSAPPIFPMLFVTIACGAISGFHGLVASGTTSKQVNKLEDSRFIGYGAMLGEGTLALASTIAAVAGISMVASCHLPSIGFVENLDWHTYYDTWAHASSNKAKAFVLGGSAFLQELGIQAKFATTIIAVLVISFAATTLDTATRIQRLIISEIGHATKINILKNRYGATVVAIIPAIMLTLLSVPDPTTGQLKEPAWVLWPIFGASNQMLAALSLMVLTLYFLNKQKPILPLLIPMIFVTIITIYSLLLKVESFYLQGNMLLLTISVFLLSLIGWMLFEGCKLFLKIRAKF